MIESFNQVARALYIAGWDGWSLWVNDAVRGEERRAHPPQELPKDAAETIQKISRLVDTTAEFA